MEPDEIGIRTTKLFCEVMDVDEMLVTEATTANDIEGWDSVSHVRLIISLESEFGVTFSNKEIGSFECLGDMISTIRQKLAG